MAHAVGASAPTTAGMVGEASHVRVCVRVRPLPHSEPRAAASTFVPSNGRSNAVAAAPLGAIGVPTPGHATGKVMHASPPMRGAPSIVLGVSGRRVTLVDPVTLDMSAQHGIPGHTLPKRVFVYDHVWAATTSQASVYADVGPHTLDHAFSGYNCSIFAYGQTGSGKTYTMMGASGILDPQHVDLGIIPRLCRDLFTRIRTASPREPASEDGTRLQFSVIASYLEIYNEKVRDLFAFDSTPMPSDARRVSITPSSGTGSFLGTHPSGVTAPASGPPHLRVREHPTRGAYVEGLTEVPVSSYEEVEKLLVAGSYARTVAETKMNELSSRSHAVFTLTFVQSTVDRATGIPLNQRSSKMVLVDLAGSERAESLMPPRAAGARASLGGGHGKPSVAEMMARQREMTKINTSLSALGAVIKALSGRGDANAPVFVPYRNSVLTWLLKDSLGGNSKTTMIATVSPADSSYAETLSTLKYCESVKRIVQVAVINEGMSADNTAALVDELKREIAMLRAQLVDYQARQPLASEPFASVPVVSVQLADSSIAAFHASLRRSTRTSPVPSLALPSNMATSPLRSNVDVSGGLHALGASAVEEADMLSPRTSARLATLNAFASPYPEVRYLASYGVSSGRGHDRRGSRSSDTGAATSRLVQSHGEAEPGAHADPNTIFEHAASAMRKSGIRVSLTPSEPHEVAPTSPFPGSRVCDAFVSDAVFALESSRLDEEALHTKGIGFELQHGNDQGSPKPPHHWLRRRLRKLESELQHRQRLIDKLLKTRSAASDERDSADWGVQSSVEAPAAHLDASTPDRMEAQTVRAPPALIAVTENVEYHATLAFPMWTGVTLFVSMPLPRRSPVFAGSVELRCAETAYDTAALPVRVVLLPADALPAGHAMTMQTSVCVAAVLCLTEQRARDSAPLLYVLDGSDAVVQAALELVFDEHVEVSHDVYCNGSVVDAAIDDASPNATPLCQGDVVVLARALVLQVAGLLSNHEAGFKRRFLLTRYHRDGAASVCMPRLLETKHPDVTTSWRREVERLPHLLSHPAAALSDSEQTALQSTPDFVEVPNGLTHAHHQLGSPRHHDNADPAAVDPTQASQQQQAVDATSDVDQRLADALARIEDLSLETLRLREALASATTSTAAATLSAIAPANGTESSGTALVDAQSPQREHAAEDATPTVSDVEVAVRAARAEFELEQLQAEERFAAELSERESIVTDLRLQLEHSAQVLHDAVQQHQRDSSAAAKHAADLSAAIESARVRGDQYEESMRGQRDRYALLLQEHEQTKADADRLQLLLDNSQEAVRRAQLNSQTMMEQNAALTVAASAHAETTRAASLQQAALRNELRQLLSTALQEHSAAVATFGSDATGRLAALAERCDALTRQLTFARSETQSKAAARAARASMDASIASSMTVARTEIDIYRNAIRERERDVEQLEARVTQLEQLRETTQREFAIEQVQLQDALRAARAELARLEADADASRAGYSAVTAELETARLELEQLRAADAAASATALRQQQALDRLQKTAQDSVAMVAALQSAVMASTADHDTRAQELQNAMEQLTSLEEQLAATEASRDASEAALRETQGLNAQLSSSLAVSREELAAKMRTIAELTETYEDVKAALDATNVLLTASTERERTAAQACAAAREELALLQQQATGSRDAALITAHQRAAALQADLLREQESRRMVQDALQAALQAAHEHDAQWATESRQQSEHLHAVTERAAALQQEVLEMAAHSSAALQAAEERANVAEKRLGELLEVDEELQRELEHERSELQRNRERSALLETELATAHAAADAAAQRFRAEIDAVRSELAAARSDFTQQQTSLRQELALVVERAREAEAARDAARNDVTGARAEAATLRTQLQTLVQEAEALQRHHHTAELRQRRLSAELRVATSVDASTSVQSASATAATAPHSSPGLDLFEDASQEQRPRAADARAGRRPSLFSDSPPPPPPPVSPAEYHQADDRDTTPSPPPPPLPTLEQLGLVRLASPARPDASAPPPARHGRRAPSVAVSPLDAPLGLGAVEQRAPAPEHALAPMSPRSDSSSEYDAASVTRDPGDLQHPLQHVGTRLSMPFLGKSTRHITTSAAAARAPEEPVDGSRPRIELVSMQAPSSARGHVVHDRVHTARSSGSAGSHSQDAMQRTPPREWRQDLPSHVHLSPEAEEKRGRRLSWVRAAEAALAHAHGSAAIPAPPTSPPPPPPPLPRFPGSDSGTTSEDRDASLPASRPSISRRTVAALRSSMQRISNDNSAALAAGYRLATVVEDAMNAAKASREASYEQAQMASRLALSGSAVRTDLANTDTGAPRTPSAATQHQSTRGLSFVATTPDRSADAPGEAKTLKRGLSTADILRAEMTRLVEADSALQQRTAATAAAVTALRRQASWRATMPPQSRDA